MTAPFSGRWNAILKLGEKLPLQEITREFARQCRADSHGLNTARVHPRDNSKKEKS
jgi:hypothetical protein